MQVFDEVSGFLKIMSEAFAKTRKKSTPKILRPWCPIVK
jgi:hypothetical protein